MSCTVEIIEDSITVDGSRLTTFQLRYWRAIHAELMTHRVFSRNASSSRAIPVMKVLAQVWSDPAGPIHWGANQAGMQANSQLKGFRRWVAKKLWKLAGRSMCVVAWLMVKAGLHKQVANRLLEPWQYISVVLSATEYDNWEELRDHKDAQPEIALLAKTMKAKRNWFTPKLLEFGEWHLPYVTEEEKMIHSTDMLIKLSVARCARVSYLTHDKEQPDVLNDLHLYNRLVGAKPWHASPLEHQATPALRGVGGGLSGNFSRSWAQYRKLFEVGETV